MEVNSNGSELHRLKVMEDYDEALFNKLYRSTKPLVKRLARNIDERRYNVSNDVIQSYFWDKFLYVFNKYQAVYDENHLKATLISSLLTFKNRLLRKAYSAQAEYHQSLTSLDNLFDDSKELLDTSHDNDYVEEISAKVYNYMRSKLSPDAYLLFEVQNNPPEFIIDLMKTTGSKISIVMLLDYFELKRTKANSNFISRLRKEITLNMEKAKVELK